MIGVALRDTRDAECVTILNPLLDWCDDIPGIRAGAAIEESEAPVWEVHQDGISLTNIQDMDGNYLLFQDCHRVRPKRSTFRYSCGAHKPGTISFRPPPRAP